MKYLTTGVIKSALLVVSMIAAGLPASAAIINGTVGFSGTRLFSFSVPAIPDPSAISYIDFQNPVDGGFGDLVSGGTLGDYTSLIPVSTPGSIKDMATNTNALGYTVVPVGTPVSVDNFVTFASIPAVNFRLTLLPVASDCGGPVTCVGAFQLVQNGANVAVSINLTGQVVSGSDVTPFSGNITAQFLGTNVGAVIAGASAPGGVLANSWSGAIVSEIPEPGTVILFGLGLAALAFSGRRSTFRE